jgi:hypothetical protein
MMPMHRARGNHQTLTRQNHCGVPRGIA